MFLRTLLIGIAGAFAGAVVFVVAPWQAGDPPFEGIYLLWLSVAGFACGAITNIICECLGLYKVSLWQRFFARKRD